MHRHAGGTATGFWEYSPPGQLKILNGHIRVLLAVRGFIVSEFASKSDSRQTFNESSGVMPRQTKKYQGDVTNEC